jgi:hypothetical protein
MPRIVVAAVLSGLAIVRGAPIPMTADDLRQSRTTAGPLENTLIGDRFASSASHETPGWLMSDSVENALHVDPTAGEYRRSSLGASPGPSASYLSHVANTVHAHPTTDENRERSLRESADTSPPPAPHKIVDSHDWLLNDYVGNAVHGQPATGDRHALQEVRDY